MRDLKRATAVTASVIGTLIMLMGPAGAATTISPNPVSVTTAQKDVTVSVGWTQPTNKRLFFLQCYADASDPLFDYAAKCSNLSEITTNPVAATSGTLQFKLFRGAEPSGDETWGCFAQSDTPPAGITTKATTCFVRVTNDNENNTTDQQFAPFTFVVSNPVIPETPLAVMIPLVALAVIGGGLHLQRRRHSAMV